MNDTDSPADDVPCAAIMNFLGKTSLSADDPGAISDSLTEEVVRSTGACCAILVQCQVTANVHAHRPISTNPPKLKEWACSSSADALYDFAHDCADAKLIDSETAPEIAALLQEAGVYGQSICVPLNTGSARVGAVLALGVPERQNLAEKIALLKALAAIAALVLRNAISFERHEQLIHDRTRDLRQANEALRLRETEARRLAVESDRSRLALLDILEDRKQAEERLKESEERFRSLYHSMNEGVALHRIVYDAAGNASDYVLESVNPAYERLLNLAADQVVGKCASEVYKCGEPPYLCLYADVAATGVPCQFETTFEPLAKTFRISVSCPKQGHFATVFEDITEALRMTAQLQQIQRMDSIGRLAGGIAHDFNNMLSVILGNTEMALEGLAPGQPFYCDFIEIQKAAQRSADLTRQLLAFARKQAVAPKVVNLNDTLTGMISMMRRLLGKEIDLAWCPADNLWPVQIDPSQIDQILANLCVNARDAINGVGRLTIETDNMTITPSYCYNHADVECGDYVMIAVSDTGCGMTKDVMTHLFEPFYTTKKMGEGTGLGLATVYGIIKQNKGFISVYSEPGQGSTFKIGLPRYRGEKIVNEAEKPPDENNLPRGQETVLLVEDEPAILAMVKLMLVKLGYRVLDACSPQEALCLAKEHAGAFQLLLSDIIMPEMNGLELAKRLQSEFPDLKCLFMSGYTADAIAHRGVLSEGVHFIQKPFAIHTLSAKLRQLLTTRRV